MERTGTKSMDVSVHSVDDPGDTSLRMPTRTLRKMLLSLTMIILTKGLWKLHHPPRISLPPWNLATPSTAGYIWNERCWGFNRGHMLYAYPRCQVLIFVLQVENVMQQQHDLQHAFHIASLLLEISQYDQVFFKCIIRSFRKETAWTWSILPFPFDFQLWNSSVGVKSQNLLWFYWVIYLV